MEQVITALRDADIRIVEMDPLTVVLKDVADLIGYRAPDLKRSIRDEYTSAESVETSGGPQQMICAHIVGVMQALARVRSANAKKMLEDMGCEVDWHFPTSIEESVVNALQTVFSAHRIECQKWIGVYRVDVLFTDYDLIVEVDENGHQERNQIGEVQREGFLSTQYTVIRYDPDSQPVESLYREVHDHILNHQ